VNDLGPEHLPELLREFEGSRWETMTVQSERLTVTVSRHALAGAPSPAGAVAPSAPAAPAGPAAGAPSAQAPAAAAAAAAVEDGLVEVRSPVLGTFYGAPKPGAPPFVQVGQMVDADDTVAIVEVMKLMNQIAAGVCGEVVEVCATNGEMVEYDKVLMRIRTAEGPGSPTSGRGS
jgi:acetyl-CoA carboxylase biotin carboxyl carrier protein